MRAIVVGPTFGLENLHEAEVLPEPLGPFGVRVRVRAASLNYRDLLMVQGRYNPKQPLPLVPCSDGAGTVIEIGSHVTRAKVGDRVMALFAPRWISGKPEPEKIRYTLGGPQQGTLAEEIVLDENAVVPTPNHLTDAEASTLGCAGLTAWSAFEQCGLQSGQTVLIQGTGGVALFALQLAKIRGARTIVTSKSDDKLARVRALGTDETINYVESPAWGKVARDMCDGGGVDLVVEVGGAGTFAQSVRATKPGGAIALIGVLATGEEGLGAALTGLLMNNIRVQGVLVGNKEQFLEMNRAISLHRLKPVIGDVFAFADAKKAFLHMKSSSHFGKIVIEIP